LGQVERRPAPREELVIIGTVLIKMSGNTYYSPTFSRGGLSACFAAEVFDLAGTSPGLDIAVEHKNHDDTTYTSAGSFASISAAGIEKLDLSGSRTR
jgi:hypothetical protein